MDQTKTRCSYYNSGKISLTPCSLAQGIEAEITYGNKGIHFFLNLLICPLLPDHPAHQTVNVYYTIEGQAACCQAYLMKGGQRVLLPDTVANQFIDSLLSDQIIELSVGDYRMKLLPANFLPLYQQVTFLSLLP